MSKSITLVSSIAVVVEIHLSTPLDFFGASQARYVVYPLLQVRVVGEHALSCVVICRTNENAHYTCSLSMFGEAGGPKFPLEGNCGGAAKYEESRFCESRLRKRPGFIIFNKNNML